MFSSSRSFCFLSHSSYALNSSSLSRGICKKGRSSFTCPGPYRVSFACVLDLGVCQSEHCRKKFRHRGKSFLYRFRCPDLFSFLTYQSECFYFLPFSFSMSTALSNIVIPLRWSISCCTQTHSRALLSKEKSMPLMWLSATTIMFVHLSVRT